MDKVVIALLLIRTETVLAARRLALSLVQEALQARPPSTAPSTSIATTSVNALSTANSNVTPIMRYSPPAMLTVRRELNPAVSRTDAPVLAVTSASAVSGVASTAAVLPPAYELVASSASSLASQTLGPSHSASTRPPIMSSLLDPQAPQASQAHQIVTMPMPSHAAPR